MDPICEKKYNFLQKYVPFLANLIKLLANDNEKQGKLAQMQLLYDLLNKPDNSVKLETLEKCEEVLCRVFGKNDEKVVENELVMPSPLIKSELLDETDVEVEADEQNWQDINGSTEHECSTTALEDGKEIENFEPRHNDSETKLLDQKLTDAPQENIEKERKEHATTRHTAEQNQSIKDNKSVDSIDIEGSNGPEENENKLNSKLAAKNTENKIEISREELNETTMSKRSVNHEQHKELEGECNHLDSVKIPDLATNIDDEEKYESHVNIEKNKVEKKLSTSENDSRKYQSVECSANVCQTVKIINRPSDKISAELNESNDTITLTSNAYRIRETRQTDTEDEELLQKEKDNGANAEETNSKINDNATTDKELKVILANQIKSAEVQKTLKTENDVRQEEKHTTEVIRQSPTEMLRFKIVSAESLASPDKNKLSKEDDEKIKTNKSSNVVNDLLDPLCHASEKFTENYKNEEKKLTSDKHKNKEEDDDDVLLVENRLSPICLDSDPEDEENMKGKLCAPIIPNKVSTCNQKSLLPKPSVRKSTSAVMETIRKIISKNQNIANKRKVPIQQKKKLIREIAFVKKDPKALMETIDLLDSDSEEERPNNKSKKSKTNTTCTDDDVIIVSSTQAHRKMTNKLNHTVPPSKQIPRYSKAANKSPVKPATAQSNFLNAVNLQPAKSSSSNPATFSARLSNKKVIIPNAFYGNPSYNKKSSLSTGSPVPSKDKSGNPEESSIIELALTPPSRAVGVYSGLNIRHVQDKVLKEWLEGFLTNFASPLQIASHACFVLLQRVLKYRFFQRLKETRIYLNTAAKNFSTESVDVQMLLDLRNVFLENDYLTEAGRRFCRFATNDAFGKPVALTTDSKTGRVTCRTRVASKGDLPSDIVKSPNNSLIRSSKPITPDKATTSTLRSISAATTPVALNSKSLMNSTKNIQLSSTPIISTPKKRGKFRKLSDGLVVAEKDEDDNDYTPTHDEIEPEADVVTERKRSLRTNRTKRKEAGFTYSEDHDDEEFEAIARKIENKKREELRLAEERELEIEKEQLELLRKTSKKTVAKKTTAKRNCGQPADNPKGPTRKKLRLANTSIVGSEDNDLLTPTWIEADDDGEVDSLLDFADDPHSPDTETHQICGSEDAHENLFQNEETIENATEDSSETFDVHTDKTLKNIDRNFHVHSKTHDCCVHCQKKVPRIVHHYVNEHRSSEVFPSRLRNRDIRRLLTTSNVGFVHLYKGNQIQYAAHCIFCDKEAKFLLPYWFEHFTMHTGEYSFKCSGCHILKPTRSLLTNHITSNTGCPKKGSAIRLVNFDTKVHQIEAHICSICNYVQLHRNNLLRHLRTQHGIDVISSDQIIKVVLLQISAPSSDQDALKNEELQLALLQQSDDEESGNNAPLDENSLMIQNSFTDNDDLSFMICGMLDVQTNLSPPG